MNNTRWLQSLMTVSLASVLSLASASAADHNYGYVTSLSGRGVVDGEGHCVRTLDETGIPSNCRGARTEALQAQAQPAASEEKVAERTLAAHRPLVVTGASLFAFNSAELQPGADSTLQGVAEFAATHPRTRLQVDGYTDNIGSYHYNQQLSSERAEAVANYLTAHGVSPQRIAVAGHSFQDPVASNATASGRAENRRVEVRAVRPG